MMNNKLSLDELNRLSVADYKEATKTPVIVVLDNLRSQNNIGSFFRTADAFRMEAIHLCGISATPPNKEIHKTALGATESVDWQYFSYTTDSVKWLKEQGYILLAIEQTRNSKLLDQWYPQPGKKYALIFGNEVKGVQQIIIDLCDASLEIPQAGTKHSLNVSVSAGIVLWEFFKHLHA